MPQTSTSLSHSHGHGHGLGDAHSRHVAVVRALEAQLDSLSEDAQSARRTAAQREQRLEEASAIMAKLRGMLLDKGRELEAVRGELEGARGRLVGLWAWGWTLVRVRVGGYAMGWVD